MKKVVRGMYWVVRGEAETRHGTSPQTGMPYLSIALPIEMPY